MAKRTSVSENLRDKIAESLELAGAPRGSDVMPPPFSQAMTTSSGTPASTSPFRASADRIVLTSSLLSAGAGAIPVPVWESVAVGGIQLKMIADLSAVYGVPFSENIGKTALASLIGGLAPHLLARGAFGIFFKSLPGVGSAVGAIALPVLAGGCSYAIGQVFIRHFESGGTMLTFDPKQFQAGFTEEVKAGMKKVAEVKI